MTRVRTEVVGNSIVVEFTVLAAPSLAYSAWTDPAQVCRWFGTSQSNLADATIDLKPGGSWRFVEEVSDEGVVGFEGKYIEISANERLVLSWAKFTEQADGSTSTMPYSQVDITFVANGPGTDIRIVHSLDDPTSHGFKAGWAAGMENFIAFLASAGPARNRGS